MQRAGRGAATQPKKSGAEGPYARSGWHAASTNDPAYHPSWHTPTAKHMLAQGEWRGSRQDPSRTTSTYRPQPTTHHIASHHAN